jgi:hypothetical protein
MAGVDRQTIEEALRSECVPTLRRAGFKGTFPNFYRDTAGFVALVNFQFFSSGGSFCVNLSFADPERRNIYFRPDTAVSKLRVSQARERTRLGASSAGDDKWYSYGATSYGEYRGEPTSVRQLVDIVNRLFQSQAEVWWREKGDHRSA